jgi:HEAT repeat protein
MKYCGGNMGKSLSLVAFQYFPFARPLVVRFCNVIDPSHFHDLLLLALQDKRPNVRCEGIQAITKKQHWTAIGLVSHAIKDRDDKVRLAAVNCLSQFGSPSIMDSLFSVLRDSNPLIRAEAVQGLKKYPKIKHRQEIQRLVFDRNTNVQQAALNALLAFHCSEDFVPKLLDLALDKRQPPDIKKLAFENMRQAEHLPVSFLKRFEQVCHEDDSIKLHLEIVKIIAAYPPGCEMQTALLQFLHHISDDVHQTVVQVLGEKGDRSAIFHLSELIREGRKENQLMNSIDARLAETAIEKISKRYS